MNRLATFGTCLLTVASAAPASGREVAPYSAENEPPRTAAWPLDPRRELAGLAVWAEAQGVAAAVPALPSETAELTRRIEKVVADSGTPGAAIAVVDRSGQLFTAGFGQAGPGRPMDDRALFRVGSLSKPFIALGILRLVEAGRLRLEDRVRILVPEIETHNPWEATHPLQVAHLLEHTAGFDEMRFNEVIDRDDDQRRTLAQVLQVNPRSRVSRWPPGTRFSYSQPGYTLAAYIIEKVSGLPFETFLEREVFGPLGIDGQAWRFTNGADERLAVGHHRQRPADRIRLLHRPAGQLMISARGLGRLLSMQLNRGTIDGRRFLSPQSLERMESCGTLPHAPPSTCYGLANWGDVEGPIPMRGHGGFMPGYQSFYRYSPEYGFGYVVLVNSSTGSGPWVVGKESGGICQVG